MSFFVKGSCRDVRKAFYNFLESDYHEYLLDFWLATWRFENEKSEAKRTRMAANIYEDYISQYSVCEVEIRATTRSEINRNLKDIKPDVFKKARDEIFALMESEFYGRFLKSCWFKDLRIKALLTKN